jgi:hypothetical protein
MGEWSSTGSASILGGGKRRDGQRYPGGTNQPPSPVPARRALEQLETSRRRDTVSQLWYYRALVRFFSAHTPGPLVEDLRHALAELEDLAAQDPSDT